MDHNSPWIRSKMTKVENSLSQLHSEIFTANKFLNQLKEQSVMIVTNLNSSTTLESYLKDYVEVNSFILKYLTFLSEINCKFEVLEMLETKYNTVPVKEVVMLDEKLPSADNLNSNFELNLKTLEENAVHKNVLNLNTLQESQANVTIINEPEETKPIQKFPKKSKNKKCKNSQLQQISDSNCNSGSERNVKSNVSNNDENIYNVKDKLKHSSKINSRLINFRKKQNNSPVTWKDDLSSDIKKEKSEEELSINISKPKFFKPSISVSSGPPQSDIEKRFLNVKVQEPESNTLKSNKEFLKYKLTEVLESVFSGPNLYQQNDFKNGILHSMGRRIENSEKYSQKKIFYTEGENSESMNSVSDADQNKNTESPAENTPINKPLSSKINNSEFNSENLTDVKCIKTLETKNIGTADFKKLSEGYNENKNGNDINGIEPLKLSTKVDQEYDIVVENIKSPSEFYVTICNYYTYLLEELKIKLKLISKNNNKIYHEENKNRKACFSKEIGTYALFYCKCEEIWLRAQVMDWCLNFEDDFVRIFLLDCGESKCVTIDDLQPMPDYFKKYPAFAVRCHLYGITPCILEDSTNLSWEKESTEKMKTLTENSHKIKIKIAPDDGFNCDTSTPVTLWLVDQGNQCINDILVKTNSAVQGFLCKESSNKNKNDGDILEINKWNPMKEDFESYKNSYEFDANDPAGIIYGYVGKDYDRICPQFGRSGKCFKGLTCRKDHEKLDPLGFTTDQEEIYKSSFNVLPELSSGTVLNVQVTCILNCNKFCCIPEDANMSCHEEVLKSLSTFMNSTMNIQAMKKLLIPPSAGQIVIAQYSKDLFWYRAKILESHPEKDLYTVFFVDFGNEESLCLSQMRAMEGRYLHLPFQAMRCFIYGIDQNPYVPSKKVMAYLNERLENKSFTITVVSRLPGENVNLLVHVFDRDKMNVGQELIDKGFAIRKEEILISTENETLPG